MDIGRGEESPDVPLRYLLGVVDLQPRPYLGSIMGIAEMAQSMFEPRLFRLQYRRV